MRRTAFLIFSLMLLLLPTTTFAGDDELSFTGIVESHPDGTFVGDWVIGGETFEVTESTEIDESEGTLTVGACAELDYIVVDGSNVALELKHDDGCNGGGDDDNELHGLIDARPTDTFIGTWTIGGEDFEVNNATDIEHEEGALEVGVCAEVEYNVVESVNVATNLKADDDCGGADDEAEIHDLVESFPEGLTGTWVVGGVSYEATGSTVFMELNGPFAVGACVEVEFDPNSNIASKIKTDDDCFGDDGNNDLFETVYGTVEAFPEGLVGDWLVNGVTYSADNTTQFKQEDGTFAVGACVEVKYLPDTLQAIEIETEEAYHCGADGNGGHHGDDVKRYGLIDSFPVGLTGEWVIDGVSYTAGDNTEFDQEDGAFAVGACVEIKYLAATNVALEIETEDDEHCGGDGETPGSFAKAVGNLDAFPATLTGTWTIDGVDYTADDTTIFKTEDGDFAVGVCVEIEFQTTNNLALEIETEDPFECGDSTTPPADDAPALNINHAAGAAGSKFVLTGSDFAPDSQVLVKVNDNTVATALTNSDGWVTFAVQADGAGRSAASTISIEVNGVTSNAQAVSTSTGAPLRNLPTGYSAKVINTNATPTAVGLSGFSTTTTLVPLVLLASAILLAGTAVALRQGD